MLDYRNRHRRTEWDPIYADLGILAAVVLAAVAIFGAVALMAFAG